MSTRSGNSSSPSPTTTAPIPAQQNKNSNTFPTVQVTARVLFGSVSAISTLQAERKLQISIIKEGPAEDILHYSALHIARAVESGINEADELFETIEPHLYKKDLIIRGNHPSVYLAAINHQTPRAKELSKYAYATIRATVHLKEQFAQLRNDRDYKMPKISLRNTPLQYANCPNKRQLESCADTPILYRTADGSCNNLNYPARGSSFQPFARYLPPEYDDGVSSIRKSVTGKNLPSPRKISTLVHKDISRPSSTLTLMLMQWGQFLDHDLTLTAQTRSFNHSIPKCCNVEEKHPDCLPIEIPSDDPYFNGTSDCMEFIRSSPSPRVDCALGAREQLNQLTSWIDGSVVYGSTEDDMRHLRLFKNGKLKYHHMPNRKSLLPQLHHPHEGECIVSSPRLFCFSAGDGRANEQPGLTTMHTLWLRQHNIIAQKIILMNPSWSDETVFQETRKIIAALIQHITYKEFLPLVLGPSVTKIFGLRGMKTGYYEEHNSSIDGTIPTVFGTAAFRFGHSLVQPHLHRCDESHKEMPYKVKLSKELMSPSNLHNFGEVDRISLGLASQRSQRRDEFITSELTNHLFKTQGHKGLDLASINIQRGRDHGLAPYLKWREACGLMKPLHHNGPVTDFNDFSEATSINSSKSMMLGEVYESPWDVDLFPGGMLELPVRGGLVGPTFACILGQVFRNLKRADRYWYENPGLFTHEQLQAIRNISLSRILCDTSDSIQSLQPIIFLAPHLQKNPHADCSDSDAIPYLNLVPWNNVVSSLDKIPPSSNPVINQRTNSFSERNDFNSPISYYYSPQNFLDTSYPLHLLISDDKSTQNNDTFEDYP